MDLLNNLAFRQAAFAACLFLLYFVGNSVGFGHGRLVRSLAFVVSTSSKEKILRLIVLRSNLKSNLQISVLNFTCRDSRRKIDKFKLATLCVSKAMSPP